MTAAAISLHVPVASTQRLATIMQMHGCPMVLVITQAARDAPLRMLAIMTQLH